MTSNESLIKFIDSHDRPRPTIDNGDGTVTAHSDSRDAAGVWSVISDTIPATYSAARQLLGY